jgi:Uma2 family endonuclease
MITWQELCSDKRISDLPFKIELNGRGQIIMSPTYLYHGSFANKIARLLEKHLSAGEVIVECAVETQDGVKEADVAWLNDALADEMREVYACPVAPEICVEIISASNSEEEMQGKRLLFLEAGAKEYWLCDKLGNMRFYDHSGQIAASIL